jgi:hypothetical protein
MVDGSEKFYRRRGIMPVHDWTRVDAGIFHHFRLSWLNALMGVLNRGLLPSDHYALATRDAAGLGRSAPPRDEPEAYALRASHAAIQHVSEHQVIAVCEIVSPGNKGSRQGLRYFVEKCAGRLRAGIHLVVLDLFPPGTGDPRGIHAAIWEELVGDDFTLPPDKPLTLASYVGGPTPEAYIEPTAVGNELTDTPLFLKPMVYVPLPLEAAYRSAWEAMPVYWKEILSAPAADGDLPDASEWPQQ